MKASSAVLSCCLFVFSHAAAVIPSSAELQAKCYGAPAPEESEERAKRAECASMIAHAIVGRAEECFQSHPDESSYRQCTHDFCGRQCGGVNAECEGFCEERANPLFARLQARPGSFLQVAAVRARAPEDDLAQEMTHDLEMNFNKIAPFGKEDTAKVAEIKRAVFRALTRLRAATIKEFDTIARLETQAIDAYNDAHHYRAENPLMHLHEDEAPVETDKLKSFH